ncbi:hypothetical protein CsSME_00037529 [Camellia sinensis var. sinensis]
MNLLTFGGPCKPPTPPPPLFLHHPTRSSTITIAAAGRASLIKTVACNEGMKLFLQIHLNKINCQKHINK